MRRDRHVQQPVLVRVISIGCRYWLAWPDFSRYQPPTHYVRGCDTSQCGLDTLSGVGIEDGITTGMEKNGERKVGQEDSGTSPKGLG